MSGTANEFENPGGNYPDRKDSGGIEPDGVEQRSDSGVGGAVHHETDDSNGVQDEPVLEQNAATTQEQIDGIIAQTRADLGGESNDRYAEVLNQRLTDAGIQITDEDLQKLAGRATSGSGGGGV
jgi:hypothetical protein